uniref:Tc3 transposase DNA binding domain-containing protein n=1 Tax=Meloidogyne floridensis TaxID=298350 RepID=A0A915P1B5_9BILA
MPKAKSLTEFEKGQISSFSEEGHSITWISLRIGRSRRVIKNYLDNPTTYGTKTKSGRPKKLNCRARRRILAELSNSTKSVRQVQREIVPNVSHYQNKLAELIGTMNKRLIEVISLKGSITHY